MKIRLPLLLAFVIAVPLLLALRTAPLAADEAGVHAAVLDYVEALYNVEPERIARSVHEDMHKIGYWRQSDDAEYREIPMNYEQLHRLAGRWNQSGESANADSPKEIVVLDVLDKTASAKLVAEWGIDYFHLVKVGDQWKIRNVLWQSHPVE